jgi:3-oxoacyl-[acyl-carrier-protein] synthase III
MHSAAIQATGSFVPAKIVHNEALVQFPETSRKLVGLKTGVFSRRHSGNGQCTSDLALKAARSCLDRINWPADKVEAIVLSTSSPDRIQPATATRLQYMLGATNAFAFDINSVCSGSTYGISLANAMVRSGTCRNVLLVAAEAYSKILNPKDFSTYPYFGDGAGAVFFKNDGNRRGVIHSILRTDGSGSDTISVPGGGTMLPHADISDSKALYFQMKGREVFEFAVNKGTQIIDDLLIETGLSAERIKCFICHQANVNIILKIAEQLGVDESRFYINLFRYGNTASASVLIALDEALTRGILSPGDLVITAAFGGGLSWGANLIRI